MGESLLVCPLCCGNSFSSREYLIQHLSTYISNVTCPICQQSLGLTSLVDHIRDCNPLQCDFNKTENSEDLESTGVEQETLEDRSNLNSLEDTLNDDTDTKNTTLLQMQLLKEGADNSLQRQEIKLLTEDGENRYVVVEHDGTHSILEQDQVITKQNTDGTISLTSVQEINENVEEETLTLDKVLENDNQEEVYSCNTCAMSFTSVYKHIQKYHSDQDVVVQLNDTLDNLEDPNEMNGVPVEMIKNEHTTVPKRVITDMGNIVETMPAVKYEPPEKRESYTVEKVFTETVEQVVDKKGQMYTRKFVQIGKFWDDNKVSEKDGTGVTVPASENDSKTLYHQAVIKEVKEVDLSDGTKKMHKIYKCTVCGTLVLSLDEFKNHPCKNAKYTCSHCPMTYDNSKSLCAHMKVHKLNKQGIISRPVKSDAAIERKTGTFSCNVCSTVFTTNKSLRLHRRMHDPIKTRPIEPPVHPAMLTPGYATDTFLCTECDKVIPVGYKQVHSDYHRATPQHNCDICNKKFHNNDYLTMHMAIHNVDKVVKRKTDKVLPYTCLYCNRQFARPHEKVKHERIHTGEKPHSCEICGKSFRVSYCLTLHMRTHTGARPYECQHCGKRFKAHSVYNHHLLTHSDVRAYKCPYCPKAFKTSVQLAGHKNSHTKPFSCNQCNRPFASLYAVRVHTETHRRQNNLKYACSLCGATYARTFALKDHIKEVHVVHVRDASLKTEKTDCDPLNTNEDSRTLVINPEDDNKKTELTDLKVGSDSETIAPDA